MWIALNWIKKEIEKLTKRYKTTDPFKISDFKNIHVVYWDLHHETWGFYKYERRNRFIFINNNLDSHQQRYVCAHELGHALLHTKINTPFLKKNTFFSTDKIEIEANTFAVELLLPDEIIYEYKNTSLTIEEISSIYGIPKEVARLKKIEFL